MDAKDIVIEVLAEKVKQLELDNANLLAVLKYQEVQTVESIIQEGDEHGGNDDELQDTISDRE